MKFILHIILILAFALLMGTIHSGPDPQSDIRTEMVMLDLIAPVYSCSAQDQDQRPIGLNKVVYIVQHQFHYGESLKDFNLRHKSQTLERKCSNQSDNSSLESYTVWNPARA